MKAGVLTFPRRNCNVPVRAAPEDLATWNFKARALPI
jgi:hypothetical protein